MIHTVGKRDKSNHGGNHHHDIPPPPPSSSTSSSSSSWSSTKSTDHHYKLYIWFQWLKSELSSNHQINPQVGLFQGCKCISWFFRVALRFGFGVLLFNTKLVLTQQLKGWLRWKSQAAGESEQNDHHTITIYNLKYLKIIDNPKWWVILSWRLITFNILNATTALSCRQWNPGFLNLRSQESTKKRWGFLKHSSAQPPHCLAAWMLHQCGDLWGLVYVGFSCLSKCRSIQTTCHLPQVRTQTSNSVWARHSVWTSNSVNCSLLAGCPFFGPAALIRCQKVITKKKTPWPRTTVLSSSGKIS